MLSPQTAANLVATQKKLGRIVVMTNGCFDVLHPGHVRHLIDAKEVGHVLVVAINSDASVRRLKGEGRPIFTQDDRAASLLALRSVDIVCIFDDDNSANCIRTIRPDIYVKGGDYSLDKLHPDERAAIDEVGAWPLFIKRIAGYSSTDVLEKLMA